MRTTFTRLSVLGLGAALILGACAQDSPTSPGLTPGAASFASGTEHLPPVKEGRELCLELNSRVTLERTCVPIEANVGPSQLKYTVDAGPVVPEIKFVSCDGSSPADASTGRLVIVFGPGIGVGSTISASFGTTVQKTTVGPLKVHETHSHTENLSFALRLC